MTTANIDAKLQQIILDRCAGRITRQQCVEEMRALRALLPEEQRESGEGGGASWPQARAFTRLGVLL